MHVKTVADTPVHVKTEPSGDRLFNSAEARQYLGGLSISKFGRLTRSGQLRSVKQGHVTYCRQSWLDAYIESLASGADAETA